MRLRDNVLLVFLGVGLANSLGCGDEGPAASDGPKVKDGGEALSEAPKSPETASPKGDEGDQGDGNEPEIVPPEPGKPSILAPAPDPASLTVHGLAAYEIVTIYAKPDLSATKLGYLRFGHRMMVSEKIEDQGEGCPKGWHQLAGGGYACVSKGLGVDPDKEPYMHQPPPRPRIDEAMPYDYGVVARNGTEMWWRTPDALERELAAEKFAILQEKAAAAAGEGAPKKREKTTKPKDSDPEEDSGDDGAGTPLPGLDDLPDEPPAAPPTEEELAEQRRKAAEAVKRAEEEKARAEEERKLRLEKMAKLPLHPGTPFLEKGFIITAAMKIRDKGRTWWRTSRGGYLATSKIYRKGTPKVLELGVEIPETAGFPFGFADDDKTPVFEMSEEGKLKRARSLEYRSFVQGMERVTIGEREYLRTAEGAYIRISDLRIAEPQSPPEELEELEHWIDVDLAQQLLVAYVGDRPVFTTLVSTGRKGTEEEPFDTPTGAFRIQTKHISSSMDGNTASDGAYSIQDVPWAMFFHGNYALHGAFWHSRFGSRRSHGCINLAPGDARWIFWWVGPELPEGWHGAAAHEEAVGTMVVVR